MSVSQPNLFARDDTFFGVCAGLGEDFGFNPILLRIAFAAFLFFSPLAAIATYAGAAVIVLLSRLAAPNPRLAAPHQPAEASPAAQAHNDDQAVQYQLPIAA